MLTEKFNLEDGVWYIEFPNYPGPKANLAMVLGADTLLYHLAEGLNSVTMDISLDPVEGFNKIVRTELHSFGALGATYNAEEVDGIDYDKKLWLCPVTVLVLGGYPKEIYYKVLA